MIFFFLLLLDVVVVNVTDKPQERMDAPSGEEPVVRTISPINGNYGSQFIAGNSPLTKYKMTYHGGSVMTSPGMYGQQVRMNFKRDEL